MRLAILDSGQSFWAKLLFAFIRLVSRQPVPDVVKLNYYRADFYGKPMKEIAQEAMRGPSAWSVGDRELMAAFDNAGLAEPLTTLIDKVAKHACKVTDEDIAAAKASGLSEDQIFELVVCSAVGEATRQCDTALAALDEAMTAKKVNL